MTLSNQIYKPSSVVNSHLSWQCVTTNAQRHLPGTAEQALCPSTVLLQIGFTRLICLHITGELLPRLSILTACWGRRSISVALSLGSPPAAVSSCHASVKPGLSSGRSSRPAVVCSTRLCIIIPYFCIICNCCFFVL